MRAVTTRLRRCLNFAKDWGYGSLLLVNLFAWRATDPRELERVTDPVGARTNLWLRRARAEADLVVAAWGNGGHLLGRAQAVETWLGDLQCLGVTAQGMPRHPLLRADRRSSDGREPGLSRRLALWMASLSARLSVHLFINAAHGILSGRSTGSGGELGYPN